MRKVIVTRKHINKELRSNMIHDIITAAIFIPLFGIFIEIGILLINGLIGTRISFGYSLLLFLLLPFISLVALYHYNKAKKGYIIRKDTIISTRKAVPGGRYTASQPYIFTFTNGYFEFGNQKFYKWAPKYAQMTDGELYDTTYIDDVFTLVEYKDNILICFNDKFFDIQV
jgi:hypothetical protein